MDLFIDKLNVPRTARNGRIYTNTITTGGNSGVSGGGSGISGSSGTSGYNGTNGTSGISISGTSGTSGKNGTSGTSGYNGTNGTSGFNGTSGTSGKNGTSGSTGTSGTSSTAGTSGTSGYNGTNGTSGFNGTSGTSGKNGTSGSTGTSGTSSTAGTSGTSGSTGTSGTSGYNGTSGTSGNGTSGSSGTVGTSGTSSTSGTAGTSGSTGTSGTSGYNGTSGTSGNGTSGKNGTSGSTGTSGTSSTSGTSGSNGTSGTSGNTGTSGTSANGTAGTSGSGSSGISGVFGGNSQVFLWNTGTTYQTNKMNFNNTTYSSISECWIPYVNADGINIKTWCNAFKEQNGHSYLRIFSEADSTKFVSINIVNLSRANSNYLDIQGLNFYGSGSTTKFTYGERVVVSYNEGGSNGVNGVAGANGGIGDIWYPDIYTPLVDTEDWSATFFVETGTTDTTAGTIGLWFNRYSIYADCTNMLEEFNVGDLISTTYSFDHSQVNMFRITGSRTILDQTSTGGGLYYQYPVTCISADIFWNEWQNYICSFVKSGENGTSGISGTSGKNGTSGTSGGTGTSGKNGTSGINGQDGAKGTDGTSGIGEKYSTTSAQTRTIVAATNYFYITGATLLSYTTGQQVIVAFDLGNYMIGNVSSYNPVWGDFKIYVTSASGVGNSRTGWSINLNGTASGANGSSGTAGTSGNTGTSGTSQYSTTSGTSGNGTSGTSGKNGTAGTSGLTGSSGTSATGLGATTICYVPATYSTGTTEAVKIDGLVLPIDLGGRYLFEICLGVAVSNNASGADFGILLSSSTSGGAGSIEGGIRGMQGTSNVSARITSVFDTYGPFLNVSNSQDQIIMKGVFVNAATGNQNIYVRCLKRVAGTITIYSDSYLMITKLN